jgi:hypothetical protein
MRTLHTRPARVPPRTQPSAATAEPDTFTWGYHRTQRIFDELLPIVYTPAVGPPATGSATSTAHETLT